MIPLIARLKILKLALKLSSKLRRGEWGKGRRSEGRGGTSKRNSLVSISLYMFLLKVPERTGQKMSEMSKGFQDRRMWLSA